jgi:hypothetical protein
MPNVKALSLILLSHFTLSGSLAFSKALAATDKKNAQSFISEEQKFSKSKETILEELIELKHRRVENIIRYIPEILKDTKIDKLKVDYITYVIKEDITRYLKVDSKILLDMVINQYPINPEVISNDLDVELKFYQKENGIPYQDIHTVIQILYIGYVSQLSVIKGVIIRAKELGLISANGRELELRKLENALKSGYLWAQSRLYEYNLKTHHSVKLNYEWLSGNSEVQGVWSRIEKEPYHQY